MSSRHTHEDTTLKSACVRARARACYLRDVHEVQKLDHYLLLCSVHGLLELLGQESGSSAEVSADVGARSILSHLHFSTLTHTHTLSLLSNTHSHTLLPFYMRVAVWLPLEHCAGRSAAGERISFYSCLLRHGAHVECVNTLTQLHACQNVRVCVRARCSVPPKLKTKSERKKKF